MKIHLLYHHISSVFIKKKYGKFHNRYEPPLFWPKLWKILKNIVKAQPKAKV